MEHDVEAIFRERKGELLGKYLKSAVAIMLVEENGRTSIIFEERAHFLKKQPGDVCLPGGKMEKGETPREAVIRELCEELGIMASSMEIVGEMDYYISSYNSIIYPFVVKFENSKMSPNKDEVDHVFKVPVDFFMETEPMLYELEIGPYLKEDFPYNLIKGGKDYKFGHGVQKEYFYKYKDYVIWGFTALIIKGFVDVIKRNKQ